MAKPIDTAACRRSLAVFVAAINGAIESCVASKREAVAAWSNVPPDVRAAAAAQLTATLDEVRAQGALLASHTSSNPDGAANTQCDYAAHRRELTALVAMMLAAVEGYVTAAIADLTAARFVPPAVRSRLIAQLEAQLNQVTEKARALRQHTEPTPTR
jgi:hypothetical protein